MLQLLVDYGVPTSLFLLMLIAGTEVTTAEFSGLRKRSRAVILGSAGQLFLIPLLAIPIVDSVSLAAPVAAGIMLLSLCPGGGISNYYCYLGRCNVLLSATITAAGTLVSLFTIPIWLTVLPALRDGAGQLPTLPIATVLGQLLAFMVLPMALGMLLRRAFPERVSRRSKLLRYVSACVVLLVLFLAGWSVREGLVELARDIVAVATIFIVSAMSIGWALGYGLAERDRPVLVIESGVRNIGVALILGRSLPSPHDFAILAGFLTGYFIIEVMIMLVYARYLAARAGPS